MLSVLCTRERTIRVAEADMSSGKYVDEVRRGIMMYCDYEYCSEFLEGIVNAM